MAAPRALVQPANLSLHPGSPASDRDPVVVDCGLRAFTVALDDLRTSYIGPPTFCTPPPSLQILLRGHMVECELIVRHHYRLPLVPRCPLRRCGYPRGVYRSTSLSYDLVPVIRYTTAHPLSMGASTSNPSSSARALIHYATPPQLEIPPGPHFVEYELVVHRHIDPAILIAAVSPLPVRWICVPVRPFSRLTLGGISPLVQHRTHVLAYPKHPRTNLSVHHHNVLLKCLFLCRSGCAWGIYRLTSLHHAAFPYTSTWGSSCPGAWVFSLARRRRRTFINQRIHGQKRRVRRYLRPFDTASNSSSAPNFIAPISGPMNTRRARSFRLRSAEIIWTPA
ncbi:hypothetical protein C8F04DRAFT_1322627 [Mycena alexandri]|uniref:Uncharacterized protein n=1 Tax=Mycena alexandri TaxID=1745969 RepID=A0AAD6TH16_9AGAR|nr:hypothetical protein C8F04DRAFT_1322627 [Mycena alexandri]